MICADEYLIYVFVGSSGKYKTQDDRTNWESSLKLKERIENNIKSFIGVVTVYVHVVILTHSEAPVFP